MYWTCKCIFKLCIYLSALCVCVCVCVCVCLVAQSNSTSLRCYGLQPTRFLCPWDFPGQKHWTSPRGWCQTSNWTYVSYVSCIGRRILLPLSHLGSPSICIFAHMYICTCIFAHLWIYTCIWTCALMHTDVYIWQSYHINITHSAYMFLINFLYRV